MGGAINCSLVSAHFSISAYFLTAHTYKRMRLTIWVYGIWIGKRQGWRNKVRDQHSPYMCQGGFHYFLPSRWSAADWPKIEELVDNILKANVVQESNILWISPVVKEDELFAWNAIITKKHRRQLQKLPAIYVRAATRAIPRNIYHLCILLYYNKWGITDIFPPWGVQGNIWAIYSSPGNHSDQSESLFIILHTNPHIHKHK